MNKRFLIADGTALLAGIILPLSLAPFGYWFVAVASVSLLFFSVRNGSVPRTVWRFYLYNIGMFATGVSWIYVSIHQYGGASPLLAGALVLLLVLSYALISVFQGYLYAAYVRSIPAWDVLGFSGLWVVQEWFRSWFLTGFPWLFTGYSFSETPLSGYAPVLGIFGVSLAGALVCTLLVCTILNRKVLFVVPAALIVAVGWGLDKVEFTRPAGTVSVSLVQGNVDQHTKWQRESVVPILD